MDAIPLPVIVTDRDTRWEYINKAALKNLNLQQGIQLNNLNSKHLIGEKDGAINKVWIYRGVEYRIAGNRLEVAGEESGYALLFYNISELLHSSKTQSELLREINSLLEFLSAIAGSFSNLTSSFAQCAVRQEEIISEMTEVISGTAGSALDDSDALDEKMRVSTANMRRHVDNYRAHFEAVEQTVEELNAARDSISGVLRSINNAS